MKRLTLTLALLLSLAAGAQPVTRPTTQPIPVAVFFQPERNLRYQADLGTGVFFGPEVENPNALPPAVLAAKQAQWIAAVAGVGGRVVLKRPPTTLPSHCVGVLHNVDEPNGKGITPAMLKPEFDRLRAAHPGTPIFLSLAGDKVLSANFERPLEKQLYLDYAAVCDVMTINFYSRNRNASRYPDTLTGDCIKKLADLTGRPVWAWVEVNDQRLPLPPPPNVNRAPTPDEIQRTVEYAVEKGAKGIGWFGTQDQGKYGWPESYWPGIDRNGATMQPQYDMLKVIAAVLGPPPSEVDVLRAENERLRKENAEQAEKIRDATEILVKP